MAENSPFNMTYLFWLVFALTIGTTHVGFVITGNNEVGSILALQLNWDSPDVEGSAKLWNTVISSSGIVGLIVGSFTAGFVVKAGRRKSIILMSIVAVAGIVPTLFLNVWAIIAGKFIYGLAASVIIVASSLYLQETIPAEKSAAFDFTTNFGVIFGITINLVLGLILPTDDAGKEADNVRWRIILALPLAFIAVQLVLWLLIFKLESLKYTFAIRDFDSARAHMNKIYDFGSKQ